MWSVLFMMCVNADTTAFSFCTCTVQPPGEWTRHVHQQQHFHCLAAGSLPVCFACSRYWRCCALTMSVLFHGFGPLVRCGREIQRSSHGMSLTWVLEWALQYGKFTICITAEQITFSKEFVKYRTHCKCIWQLIYFCVLKWLAVSPCRAANTTWKNTIQEYYCVDVSEDMNTLSRLLLQGELLQSAVLTALVLC